MKDLRIFCTSLLFFLFVNSSFSQHKEERLTRRAFMGIQMETLTDDLRKMASYPDKEGVYIRGVVPGSTAEQAGLKKGDVLISINGKVVRSSAEAVSLVGSSSGGDPFDFEYFRDGKKQKKTSKFKTFPVESYADLTVDYSEASTVNGLQRLVITYKKGSVSKPLVVFIGGIGCYSVDNPLDTTVTEIQLLNFLARNGFVCARIEKPGIGDNAGRSKACNEIGFQEEADGYVASIQKLKQRSDVDSTNIFVIGHSMGGLMGPLAAQQINIKGIIAYGTIGSNFIEYLAKTRRTIAEAYQWKADETDAFIKDYCECATWYFADKLSTAEAAKKKAGCAEYLSVFDLRSRKYNDELYALNIPSLWMKFKGEALLMWGASDYVASEQDHIIISEAMNRERPGSAKFKKVPAADHGMHSADTFQTARTSPGPYNRECGKIMLEWLNSQR